ncbi:MAG: hypothetical protein ACREF7_04055, partial [Candidatus Saccharimonadales bacterium]
MRLSSSNSRRSPIVIIISLLVGIYGLYIIASTLVDQFMAHHLKLLNSFTIDVHLLLGLGFVYLSLLFARRKRNALLLAAAAFTFMLGEGSSELFNHLHPTHTALIIALRYIILPAIILGALVLTRDEFKVKSDTQAFRDSLSLALIVLGITLAYGVVGFMLMDESDFHTDISFTSAVHHTIDQFDLTTNRPL